MGKGEDLCGGTPHQCVHCLSTETPLWRSGPDGPKTLCNACGVRYKKGKLALFKGKNGNLTAVQSENSLPVVVPPLTKKAAKKAVLQKSQSAAAQESKKVARKALPDSPIGDVVAKKPRVRARRANAGQLPGRYASKSLPDDFSHWRSACASPSTGPSSPSASPERDDCRFGFLNSPTFLNVEEPSLYQFNEVDDGSVVPDFAFLGLGRDKNSQNDTLLPMAADPCSTEQFSFAFVELGRDASLAIDLPDRIGALRALVQEKQVSNCYDICVGNLSALWKHQCRSKPQMQREPLLYLKEFIRALVLQQDPTCVSSTAADSPEKPHLGGTGTQSPIMLSEKALYIAAAESLTGLMDNVQMVGFAEACLIELLAEDIRAAVVEKPVNALAKSLVVSG